MQAGRQSKQARRRTDAPGSENYGSGTIIDDFCLQPARKAHAFHTTQRHTQTLAIQEAARAPSGPTPIAASLGQARAAAID